MVFPLVKKVEMKMMKFKKKNSKKMSCETPAATLPQTSSPMNVWSVTSVLGYTSSQYPSPWVFAGDDSGRIAAWRSLCNTPPSMCVNFLCYIPWIYISFHFFLSISEERSAPSFTFVGHSGAICAMCLAGNIIASYDIITL